MAARSGLAAGEEGGGNRGAGGRRTEQKKSVPVGTGTLGKVG